MRSRSFVPVSMRPAVIVTALAMLAGAPAANLAYSSDRHAAPNANVLSGASVRMAAPAARSDGSGAVAPSRALSGYQGQSPRLIQDQPATRPAERTNPLAAAQAEFQKRLQAYLELREKLSNRVKPLSPTADAADLTARQEALAEAMKTARANAKQGDLIPRPVADHIAGIVQADRKRRPPVAKSAVLEEVPELPAPAINRTYPAAAALPTVPALLLAKLPKLPDNLQYRFYGRHVVILDGDVQIITDYISNVLPPH